MTTYTFAPQYGDNYPKWDNPANWSVGVVPNAPDADVVIPNNFFGVTIAPGESYSVRSLNITSSELYDGGSLTVSQAVDLNSYGFLALNGGTLSAGALSAQTSTSQIEAFQSTTIAVTPGGFTNLSGGVLTGGWYSVSFNDAEQPPIVMAFNVGGVVTTDAARITLYGSPTAAQIIEFYDPSSNQYVPLQNSLQTIASTGELDLLSGESYSTGSLTDYGLLDMDKAILTSSNLIVGSGGVLAGTGDIFGSLTNEVGGYINDTCDFTGTVTNVAGATLTGLKSITGSVVNDGVISPDVLTINGDITGSGSVDLGAGYSQTYFQYGFITGYFTSSLTLNGATSQNVDFAQGAGTLELGQPLNFTGAIEASQGFFFQGHEIPISIILDGVSLSSVTSYAYTGDSNGGTLTVQTTKGAYSYKFVGNFQTANFTLSSGPQTSSQPSLLIKLIPQLLPPTISGTVANQNVSDAAPDGPFANVTIFGPLDVSGTGSYTSTDTYTVTIASSSPANGSLALFGPIPDSVTGASYNSSTGVYTLTGTASGVTKALDALTFTPNSSGISPGQYGTTTFTISATDTTAAPSLTATDSTTSVNAYQGVTFNGGSNGALLLGTPGNDSLTTSAINAFVFGAGGLDTITLGAVNETVELSAPGQYGTWGAGQGLDVINGFQSGVDHLAFDASAYGALPQGFQVLSGPGAKPTSQEPTFFFDTNTDYLWFNRYGNSGLPDDLVAFLPGATSLSASDLTPGQFAFANSASLVNQTPGLTSYGEGQDETLWATGADETLVGGAYRGQYIAQAKNDTIVAGSGGAFIAALGGNDQLHAGASGVDTFYFNSPSAGVDTIFGFSEANGDTIDLQGSTFGAPAGFTFTNGVGFVQGPGATAVAATATLAYDTTTGYLWYDVDGTGPASRTLLAFLPGTPALHASDFKVV